MKKGAFAVIDCLGFKGIWGRQALNSSKVLDKFRKISDSIKPILNSTEESIDALGGGTDTLIDRFHFTHHLSMFSDTIVIGVSPSSNPPFETPNAFSQILTISAILRVIMRIFLTSEPNLAFRGCLSFGEYLFDGDFYIGPAVDIAAGGSEIANGSFVWLHQSAEQPLREVENELNQLIDEIDNAEIRKACVNIFLSEFVQHEMPFKTKNESKCEILSKQSCFVLNPMFGFSSENELGHKKPTRKNFFDACLATMPENDRSADVCTKHANTKIFLEFAMDRLKKADEACRILSGVWPYHHRPDSKELMSVLGFRGLPKNLYHG